MEAREAATRIQCAVRCWISRNAMYELSGLQELRREGRTLSSSNLKDDGDHGRVKDLEIQLQMSRGLVEESMSTHAGLQERINALNLENTSLREELEKAQAGGGEGDVELAKELDVQKKLVQQLLKEGARKDAILAAPVETGSSAGGGGGGSEWEDKCSKLEKQMEKLKESHRVALEIKGCVHLPASSPLANRSVFLFPAVTGPMVLVTVDASEAPS